MAVYESPYYGTRKKALTGMSYGPYYGMTFPGERVLPAEGRMALPTEISERYGAEGPPEMTSVEGEPGAELEGQMADDPNALSTLGYMAFGLGKAPEGVPQMGTSGKAVGLGLSAVSSLFGIPAFATQVAYRGVIHPAAVIVGRALFPGLFSASSSAGITSSGSPAISSVMMDAIADMYGSPSFDPGVTAASVGLAGVGLTGISPAGIGAFGFSGEMGFGTGDFGGESEGFGGSSIGMSMGEE